jgi:hypothetical protein
VTSTDPELRHLSVQQHDIAATSGHKGTDHPAVSLSKCHFQFILQCYIRSLISYVYFMLKKLQAAVHLMKHIAADTVT